jgi:hypothetical protein
MTQRVDVHADSGLVMLNQLVTNTAMRRRVWEAAAAGHKVTITPVKPKPVPSSVFGGKGLFTTSNANAFGLGADWVAYQMDPEGTPDAGWDPGSRACYWMARPTQEMADKAARLSVPFIAQAETQTELDKALALTVAKPKALIGDPSAWSAAGFAEAAAQGWELLLEFYKNAQPWLQAPDAHSYLLFAGVVFGTYDASGEHPGVGGRVSLQEYRQIWSGPFSCWPAGSMTEADKAVFRAA